MNDDQKEQARHFARGLSDKEKEVLWRKLTRDMNEPVEEPPEKPSITVEERRKLWEIEKQRLHRLKMEQKRALEELDIKRKHGSITDREYAKQKRAIAEPYYGEDEGE